MVRSRSRSAALSSAIWVSLAVSRARSAATMLVSVPGRWWVVGNGHDRAVGVDESQQVLAAVDALAGYPGAAGHAADGDVGVLLTQVAQRFLDPGADGVAAFTVYSTRHEVRARRWASTCLTSIAARTRCTGASASSKSDV